MENTIETKDEMTQDARDWGMRPTIEGRDEPLEALTAGDWADGFANWFIDFYTNKINLPALRARADGEPQPYLEELREDLGPLYALVGEADRIHWDCESMAFLWEKFLGTLSQGWLMEWAASGRTLADIDRAFDKPTPEPSLKTCCDRCGKTEQVPAHVAREFAETLGQFTKPDATAWISTGLCKQCEAAEFAESLDVLDGEPETTQCQERVQCGFVMFKCADCKQESSCASLEAVAMMEDGDRLLCPDCR
jgi:hypothetical protein